MEIYLFIFQTVMGYFSRFPHFTSHFLEKIQKKKQTKKQTEDKWRKSSLSFFINSQKI